MKLSLEARFLVEITLPFPCIAVTVIGKTRFPFPYTESADVEELEYGFWTGDKFNFPPYFPES